MASLSHPTSLELLERLGAGSDRLSDHASEEAVSYASQLISRYFETNPSSNSATPYAFSGSQFEAIEASTSDPNVVGPGDLLSLAMLSIRPTAHAILWVLDPERSRDITDLLKRLPADRDLHDLTEEEFEELLNGPESPGSTLWDLLRGWRTTSQGDRRKRTVGNSLGQTSVSKILARKRPRLFPIWDEVVGKRAFGLDDTGGFWQYVYDLLHQHPVLVESLVSARDAAGQTHLSVLRTLDIVLWMHEQPGVKHHIEFAQADTDH